MAYYPKIGSISEDTYHDEDLLSIFVEELFYHMKRMRLTHEQRARFTDLVKEARDYHPIFPDSLNDIVDALIEALNEIAAPYSYFGSQGPHFQECFGYWPYIDDELDRLVDGDPIPAKYWGDDVLLINDHGNVRCGHVGKRGKFIEYWSCV